MKTLLTFCCLTLFIAVADGQAFKEDFNKGKPTKWTVSGSDNPVWASNDSLGVNGSTCMVADYGSNSDMAFSILGTSSVKIDEMKEPTLYMSVASVNANFVAPNLALLFKFENAWTELRSWGGHSADSTLIFGQSFVRSLQKKNVIWHEVSFSLDSIKSKKEVQLGFKADFINGGWILLDNVSVEEKRPVSLPEVDHALNLYPNPVNTNLHIECNSSVVRGIALHNSLGTLVTHQQVQPMVSNHELDLSAYPTGIYYVILEMATGAVVTKKILKQ